MPGVSCLLRPTIIRFTRRTKGKGKGKCIAVCINTYTATGNHLPYGITQYYLPPGRGDFPAFTPAEAGTRFSVLRSRI